jgi:hypothetical protein
MFKSARILISQVKEMYFNDVMFSTTLRHTETTLEEFTIGCLTSDATYRRFQIGYRAFKKRQLLLAKEIQEEIRLESKIERERSLIFGMPAARK